jgi:translation initiation factor IF-3
VDLSKKIKVNEEIKADKVRLISPEGENLGIFSLKEALELARSKGLDLIEVTSNLTPPVCKLGNYGKFLYQKRKKEREQRKKLKLGKLKIIRISPRISDHDLETKRTQIKKHLEKGRRVKIEMPLKGREKMFEKIAKDKLEEFIKKIEEEIKIKSEGEISKKGGAFEVIIKKK